MQEEPCATSLTADRSPGPSAVLHWANVPFLVIMAGSGLQILVAYPMMGPRGRPIAAYPFQGSRLPSGCASATGSPGRGTGTSPSPGSSSLNGLALPRLSRPQRRVAPPPLPAPARRAQRAGHARLLPAPAPARRPPRTSTTACSGWRTRGRSAGRARRRALGPGALQARAARVADRALRRVRRGARLHLARRWSLLALFTVGHVVMVRAAPAHLRRDGDGRASPMGDARLLTPARVAAGRRGSRCSARATARQPHAGLPGRHGALQPRFQLLFDPERLAPELPPEDATPPGAFPEYFVSTACPSRPRAGRCRWAAGGAAGACSARGAAGAAAHRVPRPPPLRGGLEAVAVLARRRGCASSRARVGADPRAGYVEFRSFDDGYWSSWDARAPCTRRRSSPTA